MLSTTGTYYRLIALWVLCEAMLGGIIHGLRIPVSGLIVGSSAVICICLIAYYVPNKGAILKATLVVAIFKMMLSPQAPPPAYIAVFFQGLLGELLFFNRRFFKLSCILLGTIALLESGLQRILVLTIVYGNDLWKGINDSINALTKQKQATNYSLFIAGVYAAMHIITGFVVGWWSAVLPQRIEKWKKDPLYTLAQEENELVPDFPKASKRKRVKIGLLIIWIALIGLYVQSYFNVGNPLLPAGTALKIFLRSVIIVFAWMFILAPLITRLLHYWLGKKQVRAEQEIKRVLQLLPEIKSLVALSWRHSKGKGLNRIIEFCKSVLVSLFSISRPGTIYILTAPIQSGKTTSLLEWSEERNDVFGILTPVVNGKRLFVDMHSREQFPMEAGDNEEAYNIGRFRFARQGFEKAGQIILSSIDRPGWLVIDEIGPLELRGEGFSDVLQKVLDHRKGKTILVIREKDEMLSKVMETFGIQKFYSNADILKKKSIFTPAET